jgi:hypothetical protein
MTKVYTGANVSLDDFVAGPNETGCEHLFAWYGNGEIAVPTANPEITVQMTEANARHQQRLVDQTGTIVVGRKPYDPASTGPSRSTTWRIPSAVALNQLDPRAKEGDQLHHRIDRPSRRVIRTVGRPTLNGQIARISP